MTTARSLGDATLGLRADASQLEGDLDQAATSTEKKVQGIGKALTAALTGPILGIGAAVFASTEQINEAFATIQAGTGASGEALAGLENDFREVFSTVPAQSQQVASAIADLNGHLGLSGPALQEAARAALELADATGADTAAFIDGLGRAMRTFGEDASDTVPIMDRFLVISQNTGVGVDALAGQIRGFGPVLANLGLSLTEGAAFFGQMHRAGVDVAAVMPAINARMRNLATEGVEDLRGSMSDTIEEIRTAETTTQALSIATAAFGAEGAQRMTNAIRQSGLSLENLTAGLESADGGIAALASETRTMSERLEILKNNVTDQIAAFGRWLGPVKDIAGGMGAALAAIGPMLIALPTLVTAVKALSIANIKAAFTTGALGTAMRIALGPVGLAITAIGLLVAAGVALWKNWDTVSRWVRRVWSETVGPVIERVINQIIRGFNLLTEAYRKPLEGLLFVAEKVAGVFNKDLAESIRKVRGVIDEGIPSIEIASGYFDEFAEQGGKAGASMDDFTTAARPAAVAADDLSVQVDELAAATRELDRDVFRMAAPGGSLDDWAQSMDTVREATERYTETALDRLRARYTETGELVGWLEQSHHDYRDEIVALEDTLETATIAQDEMTIAQDKATAAAERAASAHQRLIDGYDGLLTRQNPLIQQLKELGLNFDDLFVQVAASRGQDLESFRDYLADAGIAYGDTLGLMELVGDDFALAVRGQFESVRDSLASTSGAGQGAGRGIGGGGGGSSGGGGNRPPSFFAEGADAGYWNALSRAERQAFLQASNRAGGAIKSRGGGGIDTDVVRDFLSRATYSTSARTGAVVVQGDVYGYDDFAEKVGQANDQNRRGGLESVSALS